jgi:hypothetical protein
MKICWYLLTCRRVTWIILRSCKFIIVRRRILSLKPRLDERLRSSNGAREIARLYLGKVSLGALKNAKRAQASPGFALSLVRR